MVGDKMLTKFVQAIIDGLASACSAVVGSLPKSPFESLSQLPIDNNILAFVAWLVPFPQIVSLLEAWVVCVGVYYVASIIMRWVKVIE